MRRTLVLLALIACRRHDEAPASKSAPAPLVHATQADLARELEVADRQGTWTEVRRRWEGQTLRWTVTRRPILCPRAEACFVSAFPIQRPAHHGWMPQLEMRADDFVNMEHACGTAEACELVFEGTLRELTASAESATALRFSDVHVISASPAS